MSIYRARPARSSHTPPATSKFQPTRPCGTRHCIFVDEAHHFSFNPRALAGRDCGLASLFYPRTDFNPRTLWSATPDGWDARRVEAISTHAPLWGATVSPRCRRACGGISTHAPLWGATAGLPPRPPPRRISTHAPLWGATRGWRAGSDRCPGFNPRAPMGRDHSNGSGVSSS